MITTQKRAGGQITESVNDFQRTLSLSMPFDRRHPDPAKNYGIHGTDLRMIVYRDGLAIQFLAYLPVYLPHVADELASKCSSHSSYNPFKGMGADVGYHSVTPRYKDQPIRDCDILKSGKCYYDGSGLLAEEWYTEFLKGGPDVIWTKLEARWHEMKENYNH